MPAGKSYTVNMTGELMRCQEKLQIEVDDLRAQLEEAREKIEAAKNCLVCLPIGDAVEICENAYSILNT